MNHHPQHSITRPDISRPDSIRSDINLQSNTIREFQAVKPTEGCPRCQEYRNAGLGDHCLDCTVKVTRSTSKSGRSRKVDSGTRYSIINGEEKIK